MSKTDKAGQIRQTSVALFQVSGELQGHIEGLLQPLDISAQQLRVLSIIHAQPNQKATVSEIRTQMTDPMSNVSRLLNKLMQKGFVSKKRSDEDQRVVHVHLEQSGVTLMKRGQDILDQGGNALGKLTSVELSALLVLLEKVRS